MKEIILKIPDQKVDFVMELIEQLGLEVSSEPVFKRELIGTDTISNIVYRTLHRVSFGLS